MTVYYTEAGKPVQLSASGVVRTGRGILLGIFCSVTHSSSMLSLTDGVASAASAAAGRFVAPFTPSTGYTQLRMTFDTGLYAKLSGSSQDLTFIVMPT